MIRRWLQALTGFRPRGESANEVDLLFRDLGERMQQFPTEGGAVLLASRHLGVIAGGPASALWSQLCVARRTRQLDGWVLMGRLARCDTCGSDVASLLVELWRREGFIEVRQRAQMIDVMDPAADLTDCRIRLVDLPAAWQAESASQSPTRTKDRLARLRAMWGSNAGAAVHMACLVHHDDAFLPASMAWIDLMSAQGAEQDEGWVSGQELVTCMPERLEVMQGVMRTWCRAPFLEARSGDETGCVVDDQADVTEFDFRILPSAVPERP